MPICCSSYRSWNGFNGWDPAVMLLPSLYLTLPHPEPTLTYYRCLSAVPVVIHGMVSMAGIQQ